MLIKVYMSALKKISYFLKFIRFSMRRYTHYKCVNWCICAMLPWKKVVLLLLHQKWLGLAVKGKYHSKVLMLFNLAFLMKCKYRGLYSYRSIPAKSLRCISYGTVALFPQSQFFKTGDIQFCTLGNSERSSLDHDVKWQTKTATY